MLCNAVSLQVASISIPYFARVVSFTGAFCSFTVSAVFPCACFLKLYWKKLSCCEKAWNFFVMFICAAFAVLGTIAVFVSPTD